MEKQKNISSPNTEFKVLAEHKVYKKTTEDRHAGSQKQFKIQI